MKSENIWLGKQPLKHLDGSTVGGYAEIDGREATEEELDELSDDRDFVYEMTFNQLF